MRVIVWSTRRRRKPNNSTRKPSKSALKARNNGLDVPVCEYERIKGSATTSPRYRKCKACVQPSTSSRVTRTADGHFYTAPLDARFELSVVAGLAKTSRKWTHNGEDKGTAGVTGIPNQSSIAPIAGIPIHAEQQTSLHSV